MSLDRCELGLVVDGDGEDLDLDESEAGALRGEEWASV
jgi:hypothetical protein